MPSFVGQNCRTSHLNFNKRYFYTGEEVLKGTLYLSMVFPRKNSEFKLNISEWDGSHIHPNWQITKPDITLRYVFKKKYWNCVKREHYLTITDRAVCDQTSFHATSQSAAYMKWFALTCMNDHANICTLQTNISQSTST